MNGLLDGRIDVRTDGWMDKEVGKMHSWMDGRKDVCMDGWMD